jgi:MFS family permease
VMSVGPLVVALTGVPAGRIADRFGAPRITLAGLIAMAAGSFLLAVTPATLGIPGYLVPMIVLTAGYALFQTANNTAVMANIRPDQRGVISGMLNLSRNLGLITGASALGAVFAFAGMRTTFGVATMLVIVAFAIALGTRSRDVLSPRLP